MHEDKSDAFPPLHLPFSMRVLTIMGFLLFLGGVISGTYRLFGPEPMYEMPPSLKIQEHKEALGFSPEAIAGWSAYRNEEHGFEMRYPPHWSVEERGAVMAGPNRIRSITYFAYNGYQVFLSVDENEPQPYIFLTPTRALVDMGGIPAIAYIHPKGYECYNAGEEGQVLDCSFFVVPVRKDAIWYRFGAAGNAREVKGIYAAILSTFRFIAPEEQ